MTLPRRQPAWSASFAATAEEHLDDVYAYLVYLTRDRSLAEDLTADTFEKALKRGAALRREPRQRPHLALPDRPHDRARLVPRRGAAAPARGARGRAGPTRAGFAEGLSPELEAALHELSAGEREVIALASCSSSTATRPRASRDQPHRRLDPLSRALKKLEEKVSIHV